MTYKAQIRRGPCLKWHHDPKKRKPGPHGFPVRCGKCETCLQVKIDNWTGRCRAEQETAIRTDLVTLTYGSGINHGVSTDQHAKDLFPTDYRNLFHRMRKAGHKFRYVIAGEHGKLKGRSHWHILIFWYSSPWLAPLSSGRNRKFWWPKGDPRKPDNLPHQELWMHGYIDVEPLLSYRGISYVTKYLRKDAEVDSYFSHSKSIGKKWLVDTWVANHVRAGIAPRNALFSFAADRPLRKNGNKPWTYRMHKDTAKAFAVAFVEAWEKERPDRPWPVNQWLLQALKNTKFDYDWKSTWRPEPPRQSIKKPTWKDLPKDVRPIVDIHMDQKLKTYYYICPWTERPYYWGRSSWNEGGWDWHAKVKTTKEVERDLVSDQEHHRTHSQHRGPLKSEPPI